MIGNLVKISGFDSRDELSLGDTLAKLNDWAGAVSAYRDAAHHDPEDPRARHRLGQALEIVGKRDEAEAAFNEEIALLRREVGLNPGEPGPRQALGIALAARGRRDEATAEYRAAAQLAPKNAGFMNNLGWTLATATDPKVRDGKAAVEFATKACELTAWKQPVYLDTLAAAHAEAGDFDTAVRRQIEAISLLNDANEKKVYETRLRLYQARKPFRDSE